MGCDSQFEGYIDLDGRPWKSVQRKAESKTKWLITITHDPGWAGQCRWGYKVVPLWDTPDNKDAIFSAAGGYCSASQAEKAARQAIEAWKSTQSESYSYELEI